MARKPRKKKDETITPDSPHGDHIEFATEVLVEALAILRPVILRRAIRKDLASFHFEAHEGGKVTISASDEQVRVQLRVDAMGVTGMGRAMIDAHALTAMLGAYGEPRIRVHLHESEGLVRVEGLKAKLRLPGYDPAKELKNPVPGCTMTSGWMIQSDEFARALGLVKDFTDPASTRYALGGVCLIFPEGDEPARFVATSGRYLAEARVPVARLGDPDALWKPPVEREGACSGRPVLLSKAVALAMKLAGRGGNPRVGIGIIPGDPLDLEKKQFKPGSIQYVTRDAVITCTVVEGRFPSYGDVWPTVEARALAMLPRASALTELVAVAASSVNSESKGVEVTLAGGTIMLMSESSTRGKAQSFLAGIEMTGKDSVTMDALFLRQVLDAIGDRPVAIRTYGHKHPMVFESGAAWRACLMPLTRDVVEPPAPRPTIGRPDGPMHEEVEAGPAHVEGKEPEEEVAAGPHGRIVAVPLPEATDPATTRANGHARPAKGRGDE